MKIFKTLRINPYLFSIVYAGIALLFFYLINSYLSYNNTILPFHFRDFYADSFFVILSSILLFLIIRYDQLNSLERERSLNLIATAVDTVNEGIAISDKNGSIIWVNPAFCFLTGYTESELLDMHIRSFLQFDVDPGYYEILSEKLQKGETCKDYIINERKSGELFYEEFAITPFKADGDDVSHFITIKRDITENTMTMLSLEESLKEKETLLAEIHHRVKNNLAMITGLIDMQLFQTNNKEAHRVLHNTQVRLKSIALVHEKLYNDYLFAEIDFEDYLKDLVNSISSIFDEKKNISIVMDTIPVTIDMVQAVPFGLLTTEMITNAYKHAFKNRKNGEIRITLKMESDSKFALKVKDNGIGLSNESAFEQPTSLGFKLIQTLARQINAKVKLNQSNGLEYTIYFDVLKNRHKKKKKESGAFDIF